MKARQQVKKSKSFSSIQPNKISHQPLQFRQLLKKESPYKQDGSCHKDHSFSDSESSDSYCNDKKYYRCGCLSHGSGCGSHKYHDYLTVLREERLKRQRQKNLARILQEGMKQEEENYLQDKSFNPFEEITTPEKMRGLQQITEINESAEYSKRKQSQSLTVSYNGKKYLKVFESKEEATICLKFIQSLISDSEEIEVI